VLKDESEVEEAIRGGNGHKGFFERRPIKGVQTTRTERYDTNKLNQMLAMDVDVEKRATFTVTPREQNLIMVIGDTFNEIATQGEDRDLSDPEHTAWGIFSRKRDMRAPSTWPEPGDNRAAIIKSLEIQSQEGESGSFTNYGGGR
jgi:hypothetical protein